MNPYAFIGRRGGFPFLPLSLFAVFLAAGSLILRSPFGIALVAGGIAIIVVGFVARAVRAGRRFNADADREHEGLLR